MPISINSPNAGSTYVNPLKFAQGGHGEETAAAALAALEGIPPTKVGQAFGPLPLLADGSIDPKFLEGLSLTDSGIDGELTVLPNEVRDYFITTYDSYADYVLEGILGEVSRDRNVITFTAGEYPGIGGFTINGRVIPISIIGVAIVRPSILVPTASATDVALSITIEASPFAIIGGIDSHVSTDWELASDVNFLNVVAASTGDSVNLTAWTVTDMKELTRHYARCRQTSQLHGTSAWSTPSAFTTKNNGQLDEWSKFYATTNPNNTQFGRSVALSSEGDLALIGAQSDGSSATGAVYVFIKTGSVWSQQQKIIATDATSGDYLGSSVAVSADASIALIGATGTGVGIGSVYVFTRVGTVWTQQQKLHSSDSELTDAFGISVALSADGTYALIGAYGDNNALTSSGSVYVFTRVGTVWTQQQKLYAGDESELKNFGISLCLSADASVALIGAFGDTVKGASAGAAYVFTRSGNVWTQQQKLYSNDARARQYFGMSTALSADGKTALIGAHYDDVKGTCTGAVYVFTLNNGIWTQVKKFYASTPVVNASFGVSVALNSDGSKALVGAFGDTDKGTWAGAVYFFQ